MSKCEVCGGTVEVVGHTTKHYKNLDKELIAKLKKSLEWSIHSGNRPIGSYYGELFATDMKDMLRKINKWENK